MKHKTLPRLLLTLTALVLTVCLITSCGIVNLIVNYVFNNASSTGPVDFNTVEYTRPDFEEIHKAFDNFLLDLKGGSGNIPLQLALSECYILFNDAQTQYTVADIQYYNDVNNTKAKEESEYCSEEFAKLRVKLTDVYAAIVENGLAEDLLPAWTEDDFKALEMQIKLFDDEYVKLEADITKIQNDYMEKAANITFVYNGKTVTIEEALASLDPKNPQYAQEYRKCVNLHYSTLADLSAPLYIELVKLNNRIAEKAGYDSYAAYAYENVYSRDYTPQEIKTVYGYAKQDIAALYDKTAYAIDDTVIQKIYQKDMTIENHETRLKDYFREIGSGMLDAYTFMKKYNLSSIGNESGMQEGGFTTYLPSYEMPYLYLYTYGDISDISSFVHEFGHFYSYYRNGFESDGIIDVSEIQSQANELLFLEKYDLTENEKKQFTLEKLNRIFTTVIEGCLYDEFQAYVHENIDSMTDADDINAAFRAIADTYGYEAIYMGLPYEYLWAAISHNFIAPFYYISYAMSALPALSIYEISLDNRKDAIGIYLNVCNEIGFRSYRQVLKDNILKDPFDKELYTSIKSLVNSLIEKEPSKAETALHMPYDFLGLAA